MAGGSFFYCICFLQMEKSGTESGTVGTKSGTEYSCSSFLFYMVLSISSITIVLQIAIQYVIILIEENKKVVKRRTKS